MIPQYRETQGHGRRKLLTPDEVLRLPNREMLVVIRGQNILKLNKFDFTHHPMSKELVPVSILNYSPGRSFTIPAAPYSADEVIDINIDNQDDDYDPLDNF